MKWLVFAVKSAAFMPLHHNRLGKSFHHDSIRPLPYPLCLAFRRYSSDNYRHENHGLSPDRFRRHSFRSGGVARQPGRRGLCAGDAQLCSAPRRPEASFRTCQGRIFFQWFRRPAHPVCRYRHWLYGSHTPYPSASSGTDGTGTHRFNHRLGHKFCDCPHHAECRQTVSIHHA